MRSLSLVSCSRGKASIRTTLVHAEVWFKARRTINVYLHFRLLPFRAFGGWRKWSWLRRVAPGLGGCLTLFAVVKAFTIVVCSSAFIH